MTEPELTRPYQPNAVLRALYRRFFDHIEVEDGWAERVREVARRGPILYVLRNLNWLDFLALDHLTKKYDLPPIRFVNDLGLWAFNPRGPNPGPVGWIENLIPGRRPSVEDELADAVAHGGSAALFLKRPPSVLDVAAGASGGRGMKEGDELVRALFSLQRTSERPFSLLPIVFVWSKSPDKMGFRPVDLLLGPRNWPTPARALGQFAYNFKHTALRSADPLDIAEFLEGNRGVSDDVLVRRITYAVLRRLERERRAVVGPAEKAADRVRAEIVRSPRLRTVIDDLSRGDSNERVTLVTKALGMLKELQAHPDIKVIKAMEVAFTWGLTKIYRGIEFDWDDVERVRKASKDGTLVLLPSHKSHIDYLVLSYFFFSRNLPLPLIAAGDNLNFMPVGPIFRRGGAFFIRRSFKGDRLYAAVVDAYVRRLLRDGFPIELFLEGGRSRTGKLLAPKFGMLNMIVDAAIAVPQQEVFFLPVSIGYERVVEADAYQREVSGGEKKKEDATDLLSASEVLRHKYGRINLQFGQAVTLRDICHELGISLETMHRPAKRRAVVTRLGNRVMDEINRVTAVTPGALAAMVLLSHSRRGISTEEVCSVGDRLLLVLQRSDARITKTTLSPDGALRRNSIEESMEMFVEAELLDVTSPVDIGDGTKNQPIFSVVESRRLQLDTSKNIIIHFFVERGLVASALRGSNGDGNGGRCATPREDVEARVLWASRLFKHEFRFRADAPFEEIFRDTVDALVADGHLRAQDATLSPGDGESEWSGQRWIDMYASILRNFFEGYAVAARSLERLLSEPLSEKDLVKHALRVGNEMYLTGDIERREAISQPMLINAYHAFGELGYVKTSGGKLELRDTFQTRESLREIERAILAYVDGSHEAKP